MSVNRNVGIFEPVRRHADRERTQSLFKGAEMFTCRHDDNTFARHEASVNETEEGIQELGVSPVKMGYMLGGRDLAPKFG